MRWRVRAAADGRLETGMSSGANKLITIFVCYALLYIYMIRI